MEMLARTCWFLLAAIHLPPAAVIVVPGLLERLYGVAPAGDMGVLLLHRGVLFLAICSLALVGMLDCASRRAASLALGISIVGFLAIYGLAGAPAGSLRTIAIADTLALAPLAVVSWLAWR